MIEATNLTNGTKLEFAYDYQGRRFSKKVYTGSTGNWTLGKNLKFVYDGFVQIAEYDAMTTDTLKKSYLRDLNETLLSVNDNGTKYYFNIDGNKNVRSLIDASGNVVAEYDYGPFGRTVGTGGLYATLNPFRFSSEYYDDETSLVYYNFRYYSPELGRWLSRDPIEENGGLNLYGMLDNNAVDYIDLLGLDEFSICPSGLGTNPWNPNDLDPLLNAGFSREKGDPDFTDDGMGPESVVLGVTRVDSLMGHYQIQKATGSSSFAAWYNAANLTYNPTLGMYEAFSGINYDYTDFYGSLSPVERWSRGLISLGETLLTAAGLLKGTKNIYQARKAGRCSLPKVTKPPVDAAYDWLGKDARVITNKAGDKIFISKDGTRRIRFDLRNTHGDSPHGHIEVKTGGKWKDYTPKHRIYPKGQ